VLWKRSKWLIPQVTGDDGHDSAELKRYLSQFEIDPTPNGLGRHLATDSERFVSEIANSWLVLEFYGPGAQVVLPMELATRESSFHYAFPSTDRDRE